MKTKRRPKKQRNRFKPDQPFIDTAIDEFLKSGGKITKVEQADPNEELPPIPWLGSSEVDAFLLGV